MTDCNRVTIKLKRYFFKTFKKLIFSKLIYVTQVYNNRNRSEKAR